MHGFADLPDTTRRATGPISLFLIEREGLQTAEDVLAVVEKFYPPDRILPKTHFMLLEIFENISQNDRLQPLSAAH